MAEVLLLFAVDPAICESIDTTETKENLNRRGQKTASQTGF